MSTYVKVEFGDGRHSLELLPGVTERERGEHQVDDVLPVSTAAQLKQRKVLALEQLLYREREGEREGERGKVHRHTHTNDSREWNSD